MSNSPQPTLAEIEQRLCDIASVLLRIPRQRISPNSSPVEDLGCDSLELVELILVIEEEFNFSLPENNSDPVYKAVFTRRPFRLSDLAELIYLQKTAGMSARRDRREDMESLASIPSLPFTQLDGRWLRNDKRTPPRFEPLKSDGSGSQYRRRSDGMRCVRIPSASVEIGSDRPSDNSDERPKHVVEIDSFLMDAEPVSTTAYCRFLNSIVEVSSKDLDDWFILNPEDDRNQHVLVKHTGDGWRPLAGAEKWPMILVSWYGANAYSLWANNKNWQNYRGEFEEVAESFLPSEAQWEYAARGARCQAFPWGDGPPSQERMTYGRHRRSATYRADTLPLTAVNVPLGLSPFGLHHMAGNIWQWCRDWYSADFYQQPESRSANPINRTPTHVRSERGGSWIGPSELCRSSYRRGRPPAARGRCLGFRCISTLDELSGGSTFVDRERTRTSLFQALGRRFRIY